MDICWNNGHIKKHILCYFKRWAYLNAFHYFTKDPTSIDQHRPTPTEIYPTMTNFDQRINESGKDYNKIHVHRKNDQQLTQKGTSRNGFT
jgi:hypothetical protein